MSNETTDITVQEDLQEQIRELSKTVGALSANIEYLKYSRDKMAKELDDREHDLYHHDGYGYHRHPAEIEYTYVEDKYTMAKLIKSVYKTYDKRIKIKPPKDKYHKFSSIYFINIPVGLTESCITKYHVEPTSICGEKAEYSRAKSLFFDIINACRGTHLNPDHFELSKPRPTCNKKFNTEITLSAIQPSIYNGDITLYYNRREMVDLFNHFKPLKDFKGMYLSEYIKACNLPLMDIDYIDQALPEYDEDYPDKPRSVIVKADEGSLFYCGYTTISLNINDIRYNLDGSIIRDHDRRGYDLPVIVNNTLKIYKDLSIDGRYMYVEDIYAKPFNNVKEGSLIELDKVYKVGRYYLAVGRFDITYLKDGEEISYQGDKVILDRSLSVIDGRDDAYGIVDGVGVCIGEDGDVATYRDNVVSIYQDDGTEISREHVGATIRRVYLGRDKTVYLISEYINHGYYIYKVDYDSRTKLYLSDTWEETPYMPIHIQNSNANLDAMDIIDIKDDNIGYTYIAFKPYIDYSIDEEQVVVGDHIRVFIDDQPEVSCLSPILKVSERGEYVKEFCRYIPYFDKSSISIYSELKDNLDVSNINYSNIENRVLYYTKRKSSVSGRETYGWLVLDSDGRCLNHLWQDMRECVIDEVYMVKKITKGHMVVGHVLLDRHMQEINKVCIVIYDDKLQTRKIVVIGDKEIVKI